MAWRKPIILHRNPDFNLLTASSSQSGFSAEKLTDGTEASKWVGSGNFSHSILFDSLGSYSADSVAFCGQNFFSSNAQIVLETSVGDFGESFTEKVNTDPRQLQDICFGGGLWLSVGHDNLMYSADGGENFSSVAGAAGRFMRGVASSNDRFVAVSDSGGITSTTHSAMSSWGDKPNPDVTGVSLNSVAYGDNGVWVIVGGMKGGKPLILKSLNSEASSFEEMWNPGLNTLNSVSYGNGIYVAVGDSGEILTCSDEENWFKRTAPNGGGLSSVAYGFVNGAHQWVAVGSPVSVDGVVQTCIITSVDAIIWTQQSTPDFAKAYGVAFDDYGSEWLVVGVKETGEGNAYFLVSPDGINWLEKENNPQELSLNAVAVDSNGIRIAVGQAGGTPLDAYIIKSDAKSEVVYQKNSFSSDKSFLAEFTKASARSWRLTIFGTLSAPPQMSLLMIGEKTELDYCSDGFDPSGENIKANINTSQTGVVTGIHYKYSNRIIKLKWNDAHEDLFLKIRKIWEETGLSHFFLAWELEEHGEEVFLVRFDGKKFINPFKMGGMYRSISLSLIGRKE